MTSNVFKLAALGAAAVLTGGLLSAPAFAQVYRIVGPDGKVSFSDKPPVDSGSAKVINPGGGGSSSSSPLPFELRQIANKFPVTLYTGDQCGPCDSARNLLNTRGVPFTEKTVKTQDDVKALQRVSGDTTLPFGTIGGQQLKGFSDSEWTQFLDAAGYPKTSALPSGFRQAAPTPLVVVAAPPAAAASRPAAAAPAAAPTAPPPSNPAGIKF